MICMLHLNNLFFLGGLSGSAFFLSRLTIIVEELRSEWQEIRKRGKPIRLAARRAWRRIDAIFAAMPRVKQRCTLEYEKRDSMTDEESVELEYLKDDFSPDEDHALEVVLEI